VSGTAKKAGVPTTVVVDVQNVYGVGGAILGTRRKPDPAGIALALEPYGFDVIELDVPIGSPDVSDLRHVEPRLAKQADRVSDLGLAAGDVLSNEVYGSISQLERELRAAEAGLRASCSATNHPGRLDALNQAAEEGRKFVGRAHKQIERARERLLDEARRRPAVAGQLALDIHQLWEMDRRSQQILGAITAVSSYAWASRQNLDYEDELRAFSGGPQVSLRPGRLRPGFEDQGPDEKRVDTLCAIACLEHARRAVEAGTPQAVVLLSDDDDLSPALRSAAALTAGTQVRVVVAGSDGVRNRWQSMTPAADRPRWVVLDQHAWHWILGIDPSIAAARRHELARLSLGHKLLIDAGIGDGLGVTAGGLEVRVRGYAGQLPTQLHLEELIWRIGRSNNSVPRAVVRDGTATPAPGKVVTCLPARGTRLSIGRVPVDCAGMGAGTVHAAVPAPGWWRAGDQVVVVDSTGSGAWRVVGPAAPLAADNACATRGRVVRLTQGGGAVWATVRTPNSVVSVLAGAGTDLRVNQEVAVIPYDRPAAKEVYRGLLLSSAL
jgi:hypothetical protein